MHTHASSPSPPPPPPPTLQLTRATWFLHDLHSDVRRVTTAATKPQILTPPPVRYKKNLWVYGSTFNSFNTKLYYLAVVQCADCITSAVTKHEFPRMMVKCIRPSASKPHRDNTINRHWKVPEKHIPRCTITALLNCWATRVCKQSHQCIFSYWSLVYFITYLWRECIQFGWPSKPCIKLRSDSYYSGQSFHTFSYYRCLCFTNLYSASHASVGKYSHNNWGASLPFCMCQEIQNTQITCISHLYVARPMWNWKFNSI